jgi:hypothetical protein
MDKSIFLLLTFLTVSAATHSQTLQAVTDAGSTTTNAISISNPDGLCIGVDPSTNYTTKTHFLRPSTTESRTLRFDCNSNINTAGWEFYNSNLNRSVMVIKQSTGFVGIGTVDPQARLSVNGDVFARKVRVTPDGWADFVFEPAYKLPSLQEVAGFVAEHKHLPEIPSAKEVSEQGLDLGQNQTKLLQKIEEMTLYLIEQHKRLVAQQELIKAQEELIKKQDDRLKELEGKIDNK